MNECWLPIPGYPGYEASDRGGIRSLARVVDRPGSPKGNQRRRGVLLKVSVQRARGGEGTPYRTVTLYGPNGKKPGQRVGSLVLSAHVGPRPAGLLVRHLNDDSLDDRLENLVWGTYEENARDAWTNGCFPDRRGEGHNRSKLTEVAVLAIRTAVAAGTAKSDVARQHGVSKATVGDIVSRRTWNHLPNKEN